MTSPAATQVSLEKEMKSLIKKFRSEEVPEVAILQKVLDIVNQCKSAAFELGKFLQQTNYKYFVTWILLISRWKQGAVKSKERKLIFLIVEALLRIANSDYKGLKFESNHDVLKDEFSTLRETAYQTYSSPFGGFHKNGIQARCNSFELANGETDYLSSPSPHSKRGSDWPS